MGIGWLLEAAARISKVEEKKRRRYRMWIREDSLCCFCLPLFRICYLSPTKEFPSSIFFCSRLLFRRRQESKESKRRNRKRGKERKKKEWGKSPFLLAFFLSLPLISSHAIERCTQQKAFLIFSNLSIQPNRPFSFLSYFQRVKRNP